MWSGIFTLKHLTTSNRLTIPLLLLPLVLLLLCTTSTPSIPAAAASGSAVPNAASDVASASRLNYVEAKTEAQVRLVVERLDKAQKSSDKAMAILVEADVVKLRAQVDGLEKQYGKAGLLATLSGQMKELDSADQVKVSE